MRLFAPEAVDDGQTAAEVFLHRAAVVGDEFVGGKAQSECGAEVVIGGGAGGHGQDDAVGVEADGLRRQAIRTGAEFAVAATGEDLGRPSPMLAFEEAILRAGHKGVLADAGAIGLVRTVEVKAGERGSVVAAEIGGYAEVTTEVVDRADLPAGLGGALQTVAGTKAERLASKVDIVFVAVGVLNDLPDALFTTSIDALLGFA